MLCVFELKTNTCSSPYHFVLCFWSKGLNRRAHKMVVIERLFSEHSLRYETRVSRPRLSASNEAIQSSGVDDGGMEKAFPKGQEKCSEREWTQCSPFYTGLELSAIVCTLFEGRDRLVFMEI